MCGIAHSTQKEVDCTENALAFQDLKLPVQSFLVPLQFLSLSPETPHRLYRADSRGCQLLNFSQAVLQLSRCFLCIGTEEQYDDT